MMACSGKVSWFWKKVTGKETPFEHCCMTHDLYYSGDLSCYSRKTADQQMKRCIEAQGYPVTAAVMYVAVRVFGGIFWKGGGC
jgi:hypothetical protein